MKEFRSVCRICHGGCGALVTVKNGKVVRVTGDPDSPMSKGWMCVKGINSVHIANHPDRLQYPLKRNRTTGAWDRLSWDDALGQIAAKIKKIQAETGPESIALGQGTGRHHYMHTVRFANALGTPNWYEPGLAQCFIPRITVSNLTYGGFVTADYYGDIAPRCILFWGHNPLVSSPDGELGIAVKRALKKGAVGIAIDPRQSETAQQCSLWLPVRPGTDAALALAMAHHIIFADLLDHDFVSNWTSGFDEFKTHLTPLTPDWAEHITGVPASDIKKAAAMYATSKPAILDWGLAIEQHSNCLQTVRAIACLRALTGNIDVPGGDILGMNILRSYPTLADKLPKGTIKKRFGADRFKLLGGWRAFMPSAHIPTLFQAMRTKKPYPVNGLLIFGSNPLTTLANSRQIQQSLQCLDLLVVSDLFMTPTARMADYVLPAAFWTEVDQVIGYPLVAENMVYCQQKLVQTGQCRQDEWIMDQLSLKLNLPNCSETLEDVMRQRLEPLGISLEELREKTWIAPEHEYYKYKKNGFRTPSKKIELYSKSLKRLKYAPLPSFVEPYESPVSRSDLHRQFPYILTTGSRRREFFHSEHRQVAPLRKLRPEPLVEIHPATAARNHIEEGDWVRISSPRGSIRMKALLTNTIRKDVINVEHGWWFPERKGEDMGVWESNANLLTCDAPPYDPAFGTYQLRGLLCAIAKDTGKS
ncbi:MAG: molybdopterin oxidoreductase [Desulfobulbus propionicus]|nr:MAG: molybdopterin oxidoreductase [Desulfobulbus propionicus]